MSILDWMRSKIPGAMIEGWFEERRSCCRVLLCVVFYRMLSTVGLLDSRVRRVVEGVVARCLRRGTA